MNVENPDAAVDNPLDNPEKKFPTPVLLLIVVKKSPIAAVILSIISNTPPAPPDPTNDVRGVNTVFDMITS